MQGDFSVIGSEFVNFISTTVTCRILRKARTAGVLKDRTYGEMMDDLSEAWRRTGSPESPSSGDNFWIHTLKESFELMEALGLSTPVEAAAPKKRGRPKKNPEVVNTPARPRGLPRENRT